MKHLVAGLLGGVLLASNAWADVGYTPDGRVVHQGIYDGPGFTTGDLVGAGGVAVIALTMGFNSFPALYAVGELAVLSWGAARTSAYRDQRTKAQIHTALLAKALEPRAGTLAEVLE